MFERFIRKLARLAEGRPAIDPAGHFDDPVAAQTQWTPMKGGGTNFRTHKLVTVSVDRAQFKPTVGALVFAGLFLAIGLGALVMPFGVATAGGGQWQVYVIGPLFGLVFGGAGFWMLRSITTPIVFDRRAGYFWRGRISPELQPADTVNDRSARLDDIHALQILSEYCRSSGRNSRSYYSYELNLVLHDGRRVHVVDHGNRHKLLMDADRIAQMLDVPIWDVS